MCLTCNSPQGVISTHLNEKEPGAAVLQGAGSPGEWASHGALCRPSGGDNGRRLKPGGGSLPVNSAYTHPHTLSYLHTRTCTNTCTRTYLARPSSAPCQALENVTTLWTYLGFFLSLLISCFTLFMKWRQSDSVIQSKLRFPSYQ